MTKILKSDMSTREDIDGESNSSLDSIASCSPVFNNHVARAITENQDFACKSREEKLSCKNN
jgi:hypothetical protein